MSEWVNERYEQKKDREIRIESNPVLLGFAYKNLWDEVMAVYKAAKEHNPRLFYSVGIDKGTIKRKETDNTEEPTEPEISFRVILDTEQHLIRTVGQMPEFIALILNVYGAPTLFYEGELITYKLAARIIMEPFLFGEATNWREINELGTMNSGRL